VLAAEAPSVNVFPLKLTRPAVRVRLLLTKTLFDATVTPGAAPELLFIVILLNAGAIVSEIVCATVPAMIPPAVTAVELSVKLPLRVRFPETLSEAVPQATMVREETG